MHAHRDRHHDEAGAAILVEYMFIIVIMSIFFGLFLLLVSSIIRNSDQTVVGQELGVVANDIANRIAVFSNKIAASESAGGQWGSQVSGYSEAIDLPEMAQGKQYTIDITYDSTSQTGKIKVSYGANANINRTVAFRSGTPVIGSTISSTDASPKISYYPSGPLGSKIKVVGY